MGRPIVLSNGSLHVGINNNGYVHDFYFPYVGLENHSAGQDSRHRIGVWVDGTMSWLDAEDWHMSFKTAEHALIGHIHATNQKLQLLLEFDDFVASNADAFIRTIHIVNTADHNRDIRVFMHQAFSIGDRKSNADTAQFLPDSQAILHYRGNRAFVIGGQGHSDEPFDQHSIGLYGIESKEGTFRDAEDGELSGSLVEHGRVDSTIRYKFHIDAHSSARAQYWIAAGTSTRQALDIHRLIQEKTIYPLLHETIKSWHDWLTPALEASKQCSDEVRRQFVKSAMIVKAHTDNHGAVIASSDTTMLNYARDAYAYCWPRDGAYALWPLIRMGYTDEPKNFFRFCKAALHPTGYLMHKYQADGALGSSWHPYQHGDMVAPPIQEDETALTLFVFAQFYHATNDTALLDEFYRDFICPMADFLASYIDTETGLPKPSYDLWEENFLTTTYTTATVFAALSSAAGLAEIMKDHDSAVRWRTTAEDVQRAAQKHLFNKERNTFYKGILHENDEITKNDTIDASSFYGAFMYGLFAVDSSEVSSAFSTIKQRFAVSAESPAIPRYEDDVYQRTDNDITGNWWFITSLWLAQYAVETSDNDYAKQVIGWTLTRLDESGMMAEQINPKTGELVSVSPLTWSHAEFLSTVLDILNGSSKS